MRFLLFPVLLFFLPICSYCQTDDADLKNIKDLLADQAVLWNKGDVDGFMQTYWKSDSLLFGGANGVTYGWQATLDNYKKRYPDRDAMGKLTFKVVDLRKLDETKAMLTGSWSLDRKSDNPGGHFLLIWRKIEGAWKIIADHTSARCQ